MSSPTEIGIREAEAGNPILVVIEKEINDVRGTFEGE